MSSTYTLKRASLSAVLREDDVTVDNLSRIFKVTQSSVYLTNDLGVSIFPGSSGFFSCLDLMTGGGTFQVMGDDACVPLPSPGPVPFHPNPGQTRPRFSFSRCATATATRGHSPAASPKIYQRTIFLGQLEGDKVVQDKALVIPFDENGACLSAIKLKIKEALAMGADENIILTDSQGNVLLDTPGTKGSTYWKQSSRRIFAITEDVFAEMGRRKRRKIGQTSRHEDSGLFEIKDKIEEVLLASEGLATVSAKLRELCKNSEGLTERQSEVLRSSFRCCVCRGPPFIFRTQNNSFDGSREPSDSSIDCNTTNCQRAERVMDAPVLSQCCRSLIGCQQCVNLVLQEGQACVKCRSAISSESIVVVAGLSEVLNVIKALDE